MKITQKIIAVDLALLIENTLIISDLHIGYEEALNKQGVMIPRLQFPEMYERLEKILEKTKPEKIVINGDLKHEFGTISDQEWRETLKIVDLLKKYGKVVLIRGNHDKVLEPLAEKRELEITDYYVIDDVFICHGDVIPENLDFQKAKTIIIGHEHPAIKLKDKARQEVFKCFLVGKWKDKELIVMPSFNQVTKGTDILQEELLSPFMDDIKNFEVYVVGDKIYKFGKVGSLDF